MSAGGRSSTTRQTAAVPSAEPVASRSAAAGLKAMPSTADRWANSVNLVGLAGSLVSWTRTLPPCVPLASRRPSARNATQLTGAACAAALPVVTRPMLDTKQQRVNTAIGQETG
ncbi:hypothetical protein Ade02nite_36530 [Paractinoplanes deccanensis]|uniref:Uncharacterized protein n=1 Tax=Paractinoplanes deccanensis TaxID=113561 RepID=A0ABQ3Y4T4_9ACTN|nr:hypothetical protein Ade02nite_36530 [Actinoplanes deccanensis]